MEIVFCLFPVILFLLFLFLLDSFKLVIRKYLFMALIWGTLSAVLAYFSNTFFSEFSHLKFDIISKYFAPATEEIIKSLFVFWLISRKRIGFMIDAAIYGFAIGAGFALVENVLFLNNQSDSNILIWIIRGFGTALMHGGCTSLLSVIIIGAKSRGSTLFLNTPIAFFVAYIIHSTFNHFYIDPVIQTLGIIVVFPVLFILIFKYNEEQLKNWLELELSSEVELLNMIMKGHLLSTHSGAYLESIKNKFNGETILDLLCYVRIYLELSIRAKRNLMLKEVGFPIIIEHDVAEKLNEIAHLRKQIGKVGELTLSPLIRMNYRDLWKLNSLK